MKQQKIRVLLDLSLALCGYSGIPQDTRLLYKTLAQCPEVEVTGLLYPTFVHLRRHKFPGKNATRADRLANHASMLWGIGHEPRRFNSRLLRVLAHARKGYRIFTEGRADIEDLDTEAFSHLLWRTIFHQSLGAEDMHLVEQGKFKLMNAPAQLMHHRTLHGLKQVKVDTRGFDFMIVQTARSMRVSPGTQHIVRYHDMIPMLQADTSSALHDVRWHHRSIRAASKSIFVCNSEPTRENLVDVFPDFQNRSATVPYMLADTYWPEHNRAMIKSIIQTRRSKATGVQPSRPLKRIPNYIMGVSTLEPRKNFIGLIQAFNNARFRESMLRVAPNLKLLIVGAPGWRCEPIVNAMRELVARGDLIHLQGVTSEELRVLYSHAEALVYPSHAEGFGFPPLEAMQCGTPVVASDIPEHRWVLGDSALYCNSYDVASIADGIERLVASEEAPALRRELIERGRKRLELYSQQECGEQWVELLQRLKAGQAPLAQEAAPAITPFVRNSMDRAA